MAESSISPASMRIIKLLVGNPPQTVFDLLKTAGVTRTAITEQLNELVAAGFVERGTERLSGRGRPRHTYQATTDALTLLFSGNQQLLVPSIWEAIQEVGGNELTKKVLKRVGNIMAEHYSRRISAENPRDRLKQFIELLTGEGVVLEYSEGTNGRCVIRKRSCPFISMFDSHRSVCAIDIDMISKVVGRPVRQTECRHDGDPCCSFEVAD